MTDCTFVTCDHVPALDPDDRAMLSELERRDITVSVAVWTDPNIDWASTRLCLVRSTWDYHARYDQFASWVKHVAAVTNLRNSQNLLEWSSHKSYLWKLARLGLPVVPTLWIPRGSNEDLARILRRHGWSDAVIKPALGAAAHNVLLIRGQCEARSLGQSHLNFLVASHDAMVQPFLKRVMSYGERSLVFFEGQYSHAVTKKPFDTALAINGARSAVVRPTTEELDVAHRALGAVPGEPLYARVDLLRDDQNEVCISEVELVEPALYLSVHDSAISAFAKGIENELALIAKRAVNL